MKNFPLILLAAGAGTQAGTPKGLIEYNGRPWLLRQLKQFAATHGHRAVIVFGKFYHDYARAIPWVETARDATIEVEGLHVTSLVVEHPEQGAFAALQEGGRLLVPEKFTGAYVLPIEVPAGQLEVWTHLRARMTGEVAACIPECQGKPGHPVLLSHRYLETLLEMPPESKLDVQLSVLPSERVQRVAVEDPSVCMSINAADQWHRFRAMESIS